MVKPISTAVRLAAVFVLAVTSAQVTAQATVRDSSPVVAPPVTAADPSAGFSAGAASTNSAYQIQQLQQEVLELRGLLEEQGFELKRLKQQRLDDYLDLDRRLKALTDASTVSDNQPSTGSAPTVAGVPGITGGNNGADTSEAEKKLYREAIDQLLNQQDYSGSQAKFGQYLEQYPEGIYVPNVYYWQGQIYLTESKQPEAETTFSKLVTEFPDHQKVPDAKYKLATIYFNQGKKAEAKTLLEEVAASDSDSSRLAKAFLDNQFK